MIKPFFHNIQKFFYSCAGLYLLLAILLWAIVDFRYMDHKTIHFLSGTPETAMYLARNPGHSPGLSSREGVQYFKTFLRLSPDSIGGRSGLGLYYTHLGKFKKAARLFEEAGSLSEAKYGQAQGQYYNQGVVLFLARKYQEAIPIFEKEVRLTLEKKFLPFQVGDPYYPDQERMDLRHIQTKVIQCYAYMLLSLDNLDSYEGASKEQAKRVILKKLHSSKLQIQVDPNDQTPYLYYLPPVQRIRIGGKIQHHLL